MQISMRTVQRVFISIKVAPLQLVDVIRLVFLVFKAVIKFTVADHYKATISTELAIQHSVAGQYQTTVNEFPPAPRFPLPLTIATKSTFSNKKRSTIAADRIFKAEPNDKKKNTKRTVCFYKIFDLSWN